MSADPPPKHQVQDRQAEIAAQFISSAQNAQIKKLRSLSRKKGRQETELFLAEGARILLDAARQNIWPKILVFAQGAITRLGQYAYIREAAKHGCDILETPAHLISSISQKDNPQTIIGAFSHFDLTLPSTPHSADTTPCLWLGLHEIRDPGNLGTIIRTADAVGADGIVLLDHCADPFSFECVRASMGALFSVPLAKASSADFWAWCQDRQIAWVGASLLGDQTPQMLDNRAMAILMGNEQRGLPATIEAQCAQLVKIPMRGHADSLNVAVSASLMLYAAWQARDFAGAKL